MPESATLSPPDKTAAAPATTAQPAVTTTLQTPMDRMRNRMKESSVMADLSSPDPIKTAKPLKDTKAPEPPKQPEPAKAQDEPPPTPAPETDPLEGDEPTKQPETKAEDAPPAPDKQPLLDDKGKPIDKTKVSPWKLLDQFKGRLTAAEKENIELKERLAKVPDITKLESIEKRNNELEEEIRYQNFSKSKTFQENYQKPYEEAWTRAMEDLSEIDVLAEDGSIARKATASDLISLARMPVGEAKKLSNQMFGDLSNEVMNHRQKIKELSDAQQKALENARKEGSERETKMAESSKAAQAEAAALWERFNTEDSSKYEFLKPKEGDDEFNSKLDKATQLVSNAFSQNPTDPSLTPEQRAKAVRARVAIKNRAVAYSTLKLENARLQKQLKERDDKLKAYEASEPTGGSGGNGNGKPQPASTPMERAKARLRSEAVPMPSGYY